jgi:6-phosphogluconate dehydrogenase
MEVGFIGLGRMGMNMVIRMLSNGTTRVVVWNRTQDKVFEASSRGAIAANSIEDMVGKLQQQRKIVWTMLPSGQVTEDVFLKLLTLLDKGDVIIEGGNSNFHDSIRRSSEAAKKGIDMLDVGVSGGIVAAQRGYALMVGGKKEIYDYCLPLFVNIAIEKGYGYVGNSGSGHYVKMVHNAIEYGMMQSIAEGFELLQSGSMKDIDPKAVSGIWSNGCIISSFLMDMAHRALEKSPTMQYEPVVDDSGEGRWAIEDALDNSVPFVANTYALNARYISRSKDSLAFRMLAAIRNEFGGHQVRMR